MPFEIPNLTLLRQFLVTAEEGGISKAASRLRISQPALSKNIHRLEDLVGTKLFDRHSSGSSLTAAGQLFFQRAQVIGLEYQHALQDIRNSMADQSATISIGAGPIWSSTVMPSVIEKFHTIHPQYKLQVRTGSGVDLTEDLRLGRIDIFAGALVPSVRLPGFAMRPFAQSMMSVLSSKNHPLQQLGATANLAAVAAYPFVAFSPSTEVIDTLSASFRASGAAPPKFTVETSSLFSCIELVRSGRYLIYETEMLIDSRIGKDLVIVEAAMDIWPFTVGISYREGMDRVAHMRVLMRIMEETLQALVPSRRPGRMQDAAKTPGQA